MGLGLGVVLIISVGFLVGWLIRNHKKGLLIVLGIGVGVFLGFGTEKVEEVWKGYVVHTWSQLDNRVGFDRDEMRVDVVDEKAQWSYAWKEDRNTYTGVALKEDEDAVDQLIRSTYWMKIGWLDVDGVLWSSELDRWLRDVENGENTEKEFMWNTVIVVDEGRTIYVERIK